jgi:DNA-binding NtrC family response regulator
MDDHPIDAEPIAELPESGGEERLLHRHEYLAALGKSRKNALRFGVAADTQREVGATHRLNVFDIRIPPLRERREDIVILAQAFLEERARSTGGARVDLTAAATRTLIRHEWRGNVRELHNALERATIVCEDGLIRAQDLSLAPPPKVSVIVDSTDLKVVERQAIERAMRNVSGNKTRAARQLGISRTQLYHRLRKYGLEGAGA